MAVKRPPEPAPESSPDVADDARAIDFLWGEKGQPARGPKPTLNPERIAQAAIAIADAEGLAAVSMQRVAAAFGFSTMALYRYMPGKAELIGLMFDTGMGPPPDLRAVAGGWRGRLSLWAHRMSDRIHAHPWSLDLLNRLRVMGPNELAWMEAAAATLDGSGLTGAEAMDAIFALVGHVRVAAQYSVAQPAGGLTSARWSQAVITLVHQRPAAYPALSRAIDSGAFTTEPADGLDFGLDRILDGIGVRIGTDAVDRS